MCVPRLQGYTLQETCEMRSFNLRPLSLGALLWREGDNCTVFTLASGVCNLKSLVCHRNLCRLEIENMKRGNLV